jgi:four helix bundle protein
MATVQKFEDLIIWQKARILAQQVYQIISKEPLAKDYKLANQMNSSSGSIMDNIAEGFERNGKREFIQFLSISKGSCGELRSQLYRAFDRKYFEPKTFETLCQQAEAISGGIQKLMNYLVENNLKGTKYKVMEPETHYGIDDNSLNLESYTQL